MFLVFVEVLIIAAAARDSRGTSKDISTDDISTDSSPANPMRSLWNADCPKYGEACTTDSRCHCKSEWTKTTIKRAAKLGQTLDPPRPKLVASVNPASDPPELNCLTCDTSDKHCPYFEDTADTVSRDQVGSRHEGCTCNYVPDPRPPWNQYQEGSKLVKVAKPERKIGVAFVCMEHYCPIYNYLPGAGSVCASNHDCECPFPYQKIIRNKARTCLQCASPICPLKGTLRCGEPGCVCPTIDGLARLIVLKGEDLDAMNGVRAMYPGVLGPENGACLVCELNNIARKRPEEVEALTAEFYEIVAKYSGGTLEFDSEFFHKVVAKYSGRKSSDALRELQLREELARGLNASRSKGITPEHHRRQAAEDSALLRDRSHMLEEMANKTSSVGSPTRFGHGGGNGTFTTVYGSPDVPSSLPDSPSMTPRVSARSIHENSSGDLAPMLERSLSARSS